MPAIKFRGVDFLEFDKLLSEDERLVRNTARQFIEDNLVPIIEECNRAGRFPHELVKPMADLGFLAAPLKGSAWAGLSNIEGGALLKLGRLEDAGDRPFEGVHLPPDKLPIYAFLSA